MKVKKSANRAKPINVKTYTVPTGKVLCLRTCNADGTSHGGFVWPKAGTVKAPDWNPAATCGNGLHGLLWGGGDSSQMDWSESAIWYVVEVDADKVVDIGGDKVKFPACRIVYCGDRVTACNLIAAHAPKGTTVHGSTATAGYGGTATAGDGGTATAGDGGTATAGYRGTATAGYRGVISIEYHDHSIERYRRCIAEVGFNGIKANTKYRVTDCKLVEAND